MIICGPNYRGCKNNCVNAHCGGLKLTKMTVEAALNAEMDYFLDKEEGNSRNGYNRKQLKGDHGQFELNTPRDRQSKFEPQLFKKRQTRITGMDDQIMALYAKGMSTRDIVDTFEEMYGVDISPALVSQVTNSVMERVVEWQSRPLEPVYPIVYLDCIVVKIRQDKRVINKAVYLAPGINLEGKKELPGMWLSENEGAKFWLSVLTELQNRGLQHILIACVDGLSGFPEAIELERFAQKWDDKYPQISRSWKAHWPHLITLFDYPEDIRRVIYTTNAIESVNSVIRKAIKNRRLFPNDDSAMKVIYLAIQSVSRKWTMPIRNWKVAMNRFIIEFEEQLAPYI